MGRQALLMMFMVHDSLTMMAQSGHIHDDKRIFNMFEIPICAIIELFQELLGTRNLGDDTQNHQSK